MQSTLTTNYDPHALYEHMTRAFSLREHELRVVRDEFAFLQTCGGVSNEDIARFRVAVLKHMPPLIADNDNNNDVIVVKDEPDDTNNETTKDGEIHSLQGGGLISLKSMLLALGCNPASSINQQCRRVKALLLMSHIPTFRRHGATHVLVSDCMRVKSVLGLC